MSHNRADHGPPRPQHTTLAGGAVIGASVGVIITVGEQLADLHSLETRELVADFLSEPPGSGLGLDLSGALLGWRIVLMAVAGLAAVAAVLGYHALQRSHGARVGLAVVAVPIFLGGLVAGGFLTSVIAAAALLLWLGPSRDFFDGVPPRDRNGPTTTSQETGATRATSTPPRTAAPSGAPPPPPAPVAPAPGRTTGPAAAGPRPDALLWACVLTWALCAVVLTVVAAGVTLVATSPELVVDQLRSQDPGLAAGSRERVRGATYAGAGVVGVWSVLAVVVAWFAYRRAGWARLSLLASAAAAGVVCLVGVVTSLLMVLPAAGCVAVVLLLNRAEVRAWFARP